MKNTVVACVDGSPSTGPVCDYAAWASAVLSAPLTLLHVLEKDGHPAVSDLSGSIGIDSKELFIEELVRVEGERNRLLMAQGEAILTACAERLTRSGLPKIRQMQVRGTLDEILAGLDDVRLMVLGRRGAEHTVGSQLESVIRLQKEPVLVVPETFSTPSRVLFAWDGSETSRRNLTRLTVSPLLRDLNCHVVMVNGDDASLHDAHQILQAAGIDAESRLIQDESVSRGLCRYAEENGTDLIVMGAWGHSRLRRFFIGSHTTAMLTESRHPLLMLR
ncbi:MAG: universal stress protein [Mixta calida]|uniref:universal stress protein n=1 Tax=Mixta calida TaxID=665913 RepID=UPI002902B91D|nr:universal stress protein [Mixta calida]MDU3074768.1 universal stress protein [Mixta calida]MDU6414613.1 universal stress protein [Mixta calida]